MARSRTLTIRLIKDGFDDEQLIKTDQKLRSTKIKAGLGFEGEIYYRPSVSNPPAWVQFVNKGAATPISQVFSAQASALIILKVRKSRFALSFGHAWQWLDECAIERRFGLLAALNCIEDDQIRVVDAQQIDSLALSRRAQVSHSSEIMAFGLDIRRDLMKAIVGRPKSPDIGNNIMGADALRIVCKVEFAELAKKCEQLLELSRKENYKEKYPWVDNIEIVKDPNERDKLDEILIDRINGKDVEGIFLSPPRIRDITTDQEYRFHFDDNRERRFDVEFDDFMGGVENKLPITLTFLKKHKIEIFAGDSVSPIDRFSLYSSIVFEMNYGSRLYCLIEGEWYKVAQSHVDFVDNRISKIAISPLRLPAAKKKEKETAYNERAANLLASLCLDRKMVNYGGGSSKVEICDILMKAPCFIHVKRATGSQLLSHLFNQGVVAAQFMLEEEFRTLCKAKSDDAHKAIFESPFSPEKNLVTFAVISPNAGGLPKALPFFSKQTLVNAADLLGKFKYRMDIAGIRIE